MLLDKSRSDFFNWLAQVIGALPQQGRDVLRQRHTGAKSRTVILRAPCAPWMMTPFDVARTGRPGHEDAAVIFQISACDRTPDLQGADRNSRRQYLEIVFSELVACSSATVLTGGVLKALQSDSTFCMTIRHLALAKVGLTARPIPRSSWLR